MQEYLRRRDMKFIPYSQTKSLIFSSSAQAIAPSEKKWAKLLRKFDRFKAIHEYAAECAMEIGGGARDIELIGRALKELREAGFLVSKEEMIAAVVAKTTPSAPAPINAVALPAQASAEMTLDTVESYVRNSTEFGHHPEFLVIGQALRAQDDQELEEKLRRSVGHQANIRFIGNRHRREFANKLMQLSGAPEDVVEFLLSDQYSTGFDQGSQRNVALLYCIGRKALFADSHSSCVTAQLTNTTSDWLFASKAQTELLPHKNTTNLLADPRIAIKPLDYLKIHGEALGTRQGAWATPTTDGGPRFGIMSDCLLETILKKEGIIAVTKSGSYGQQPPEFSLDCLLAHNESRDSLHQSESFFRSVCAARSAWNGPALRIVSDLSGAHSALMGVDLDGFVPPFMPISRRTPQSSFFSLMALCAPRFLSMSLPLAVLLKERTAEHVMSPSCYWNDWLKPDLELLVNLILETYSMPDVTRDPWDTIASIGRHFIQVASLSVDEFQEIMILKVHQHYGRVISSLEKLLQAHRGEPMYWGGQVRSAIGQLERSLADPLIFFPTELRDVKSPEDLIRVTKKILLAWGRALKEWPGITQAARDLTKDQRAD